MSAQQNKQLVQEAYRMFLGGDVRGVIERCHDDTDWISPDSDYLPFAGHFHGKRGVAEFFAKLDAAARIIRYEPQEFIAEDDKVVVLGEATWQARTTGRNFDMPWTHVFTIRDGKLARFQAYSDTAAAERAFRPDQGAQPAAGKPLHH